MAQSYSIFCQFRSKLAITHASAIKSKEKCDAVVVDCHHNFRLSGDRSHHNFRLCDDRMKMSLSKKKFFFFRETPTSPWVPFRA